MPNDIATVAESTARDITGFAIWQIRYLRLLTEGKPPDQARDAVGVSPSSLANSLATSPRLARAERDAIAGIDVLGLEGGRALAKARLTAWVDRLDHIAMEGEHERDSVTAINSGAAIAGAIGQGAQPVQPISLRVSISAAVGQLAPATLRAALALHVEATPGTAVEQPTAG